MVWCGVVWCGVVWCGVAPPRALDDEELFIMEGSKMGTHVHADGVRKMPQKCGTNPPSDSEDLVDEPQLRTSITGTSATCTPNCNCGISMKFCTVWTKKAPVRHNNGHEHLVQDCTWTRTLVIAHNGSTNCPRTAPVPSPRGEQLHSGGGVGWWWWWWCGVVVVVVVVVVWRHPEPSTTTNSSSSRAEKRALTSMRTECEKCRKMSLKPESVHHPESS